MRVNTVASSLKAGYNDGGKAERWSRLRDKDLMEWTANYSAEFNKHKINALIGYSWEEENYEETHVQTRGFVTDLLGANNLAAGQNLNPGDAESEMAKSPNLFYTQEPIIASMRNIC